ncbi:MAG: DEAD/DEAH box helicase family protein, partial [Pseudomonadales bacterium]
MAFTEADTCRVHITPALKAAGWGVDPYAIGEQRQITDGRILLIGGKARRAKVRKPDYILYYRRDFPIAVVEAKEAGLPAENGIQQVREYAEMLKLRFAYATNGARIIEIDYTDGSEREVERFPTPGELWARLKRVVGVSESAHKALLEPYNLTSGKSPRYYQDATIREVVEAILSGKKRVLATLATGTGKTNVAFQVCWKLWNSGWNRRG